MIVQNKNRFRKNSAVALDVIPEIRKLHKMFCSIKLGH